MSHAASPTPSRARPVAVLIGFMGAGKTTVGAALARILGAQLVDTDVEIERRSGRSIPQIFADDGEDAFRALEAQVVADVLATHDGVVAVGGGAVTTSAVRAALAGHAVVHLDVDPAAGWRRVRGSDRPLLRAGSVADAEQRYRSLHAQRAATYATVAVHHVDTTDRAADDLARSIAAALTAHPSPAPTTPTAGSTS